MTIGTDNPVPSDHPLDLLANAQNFDEAMNSSDPTFTDRLGVSRATWASIEGAIVYSGLIANAPSASLYTNNETAFFSDVGDNGAYATSNGTAWRPKNGAASVLPRILYPVIIAPSGTINTGSSANITLGTNLTNVYSAWVYLPAIATTPAITAGFHFVVFSTGQIGTIYGTGTGESLPNNTPSSTPLNITAGTTWTGDLNEITVYSTSAKLQLMGEMGELYWQVSPFKKIGTSQIAYRIKVDGVTLHTLGIVAGNTGGTFNNIMKNYGTGKQIVMAATVAPGTGTITGTADPTLATIDTTTAKTFSVTVDMGTSTDVGGIWNVYGEIRS